MTTHLRPQFLRKAARSVGIAAALLRALICSLVLASACNVRQSTAASSAKGGDDLQIYFIDVEGGQSTLIVTPNRRSLLIDAGFPADGGWESPPGDPAKARDANRILAAAHDAGLVRIDYLLVTHFHQDHDGGVPELARLIPIREFIDHGVPSEDVETNVRGAKAAFAAYDRVRRSATHLVTKVGDRLTIDGMVATVVSSAASVIPAAHAVTLSENAGCQNAPIAAADPYENPRSTGVVIEFGKFRFLDLGDLTGPALHALACPTNRVGPVDVYLVPHHGGADAADLSTIEAFKPRIAVMNNGRSKGGARETYRFLHEAEGLESVWQLHSSDAAADLNFPPSQIANLDETTAFWIKVVSNKNGSFKVFNARTNSWADYAALR